MNKNTVKLQGVTVPLVGHDGNAMAIMARVTRAMRRAGYQDLIDEYMDEAMSGDYNHLLTVTMEWVNVT